MDQRISGTLTTARALLSRRVCITADHIPYWFQEVPPRKLLNWFREKWSMHLRPVSPWSWPTQLQVEPSTRCNLHCTFCPLITGLQRPTGLMALETFQKAIDELADYLLLITFWGWGEPFLNPAAYDMITYARQRGIKVVSSTNGHLFARGDQAEQLVRSGIDSIIFAVDGLSQQSYQTYRAGGKIETVFAGIRQVVALKRATKASRPLVHLRFLAMRHNEHEIPRLESVAQSLGVDAFSIKTLNPYDQGECHSTIADGREFIPEEPHYQRFEYDPQTELRVRLERNPCLRIWNHPMLYWDGNVSLCDFDLNNRYTLGDLKTQSFRDIWWGTPVTELRRQFTDNYQQIGLCADCTYAFKGGTCSTETIAEAHLFHDPSLSAEAP